MINVDEKKKCCGCAACVQICPQKCISFYEDNYGFQYPLVNEDYCIDCHLCEKVCPCLCQSDREVPLYVYASINPNDKIRMESSSGGIFSILAEGVIAKGGIVFGARFDKKWEVIHDFTETKEGIGIFRGSKYSQSKIGESFKNCRMFLKQGRLVLFSGTGCQISGLKLFLQKDYENLLTVEILCHGVPSPLIWRRYLDEISHGEPVEKVNFRSKKTGWSNYSYSLHIKTNNHEVFQTDNPYMNGMITGLTTRPSCGICPTRFARSGADLIIGDCWGIWDIDKEMDDDKGVSLSILMTEKGKKYYNSAVNTINRCVDIKQLLRYNSALCTGNRLIEKEIIESFFKEINGQNVIDVLLKYNKKNKRNELMFVKLLRKIFNIAKLSL